MAIYLAFTLWLLLILFAGRGVFLLLGKLIRPASASWILLPGTIVSEMAYIFGCLITGGEIRKAKLLPDGGGSKDSSGEPATEATQKLKTIGPIIASIIAILACGAAIVGVNQWLGDPVMKQFLQDSRVEDGFWVGSALPEKLPPDWNAFWDDLHGQVRLMHRLFDTLRQLKWSDWKVGLFVYLAVCFSVRLAPVGRPFRPTLIAVVLIAGTIMLVGCIFKKFQNLMTDPAWPLLTYVWTSLLILLSATLIVHGAVALVRAISGSGKGSSGGARQKKEK